MMSGRMCLLALLILTVCVGCADQDSTTAVGSTTANGTPSTDNEALSPDQILDRMIRTYRSANTYRDETVVRQVLRGPEGDREEKFKLEVSFARRTVCESSATIRLC